MSTFTQDNRVMKIETPYGKDALVLTGFLGSELISGLFRYELEMASEKNDLKFEDIIGKGVTVSLMLHDGSWRYFNGIISSFRQTRGAGGADHKLQLAQYKAIMVPEVWLLSRTTDSRIFQNMKPLEIIEQILTEKKVKNYRIEEKEPYVKREYCVQYNETDFNFISRLMEHEGIFYFFEHENGKHTMVIADNAMAHKPCPGQETAWCQIGTGNLFEKDFITGLERTVDIRPDKYSAADFNFKMPTTDLKIENDTKIPIGPPGREVYEYPGYYENRKDGENIANIRMQEEEAMITVISGSSRCRAFSSGFRFELKDHYREDMNGKQYIITAIKHEAKENIGPGGEPVDAKYENFFSCIPHEGTYRPRRITPKPRIYGTQTAIVTGPKGEEIYTDEHGRVKVQFHWDREGKRDDKSSCFIRVGQIWAGQGWGGVWIPRIGHEVIVDFIEGDPDRPIITGSVYNGHQTPPYALPANATQSGVKTHSSKGGGGSNYNEIRFEDKKGSEQILVHAEMNMDTVVEANKTLDVGGDKTSVIHGYFEEEIQKGEVRRVLKGMGETIKGGMTQMIFDSEHREVTGGVDETIDGGEKRTISGGVDETISGGEKRMITGDHTETITGAVNQSVLGGMTVTSPMGITLDAVAGITINAPGGYSVVAPGGNTTVDSWFTKIGGKDEDLFAVQTAILSMQTTIAGMSTAMQATKIDVTGIALERCGVKSANEPLTFKQASTKLKSGAIGLYMYTMTLIN